jgi:hypothetical protein
LNDIDPFYGKDIMNKKIEEVAESKIDSEATKNILKLNY